MTPTFGFLTLAARSIFVPPEPDEPTLVFLDTFTDGDLVTLDGHLPDVGLAPWSGSGAGLMNIISNRCNAVAGSGAYAWQDLEIADFQLSMLCSGGSSTTVIVRYVDDSNHWRAIVTSAGILRLQSVISGTITTVLESGTHTVTDPYTVTVTTNGNNITVEALGDSITYPSASFQNTATKAGFRGANMFFDTFTVYTLV